MMHRLLLFVVAALFGAAAPAQADYLVVSREVIIHSGPSSDSDELGRATKGAFLDLVDAAQTNGYYYVNTTDGVVGFVYRTFVRRRPGSPPGASSGSGELPVYESLDDCPVFGRTHEGTPHAVTNEVKRNLITSGTPRHLTFADFATLQNSAEFRGVKMGNTSHLSQGQRTKKLSGFSVGGQSLSEGDYVALTGYIEEGRSLKGSGGESVNCNLKGYANNDIHIPLVEDPDEDEYSSVVVEPIPQDRPAAWTVAEFKRLQKGRRKVMVYGQLFFDNSHLVRDDPDNEEGLTNQPKRFTVWEVHPVSRLFECTKANGACDPKSPAQWKEIR